METSLFATNAAVKNAIKYVDFFIVDIKILNPDMCKAILGGDIDRYKSNIEIVCSNISHENIVFRIPCSANYTLENENKELIVRMLSKYVDIPIEIFNLHRLGQSKYESLAREYHFMIIEKEEQELQLFYKQLIDQGFKVQINKV